MINPIVMQTKHSWLSEVFQQEYLSAANTLCSSMIFLFLFLFIKSFFLFITDISPHADVFINEHTHTPHVH